KGGYSTVYANNAENLVKVLSKVHSGQVIARVGQTERSEVPYLHFEIRHHHKALDPISFLP
ncbi:MAG: M23 family metallopeptidase, partial [bacterium]